VGILGQGWKSSSNASQWSSANQITKTLEDTGIKVSESAIKNGIPKVLGKTGKYLGWAGVGMTVINDVIDSKYTLGEAAKVGIDILTIYSGPVGVGYAVLDLGVQVATGTSITDRIGKEIDGN